MSIFEVMWVIYMTLTGLCFGSFLDVVVHRTHEESPWWKGRSYCETCKRALEWYELIPVLSYCRQLGHCRGCNTKLSLEYPIVELVTGFGFGWLAYSFGISFDFFILSFIYLLLLGNFVSDVKYMELPDLFSIPLILAALLYQFIHASSLSLLLIAMAVGGGFFALQYVLTRGKGIGSGDIRLGLFMGAFLNWPLVLPSIMFAYISGSIIAIGLLAGKKKDFQSALPLGAFLIPSTIVVFLFKTETIGLISALF